MAIIQTGWSDSKGGYGSALGNSENTQYFYLPISTINSVLSSLPSNCLISNITITASLEAKSSRISTFELAIGYGSYVVLSSSTTGSGLSGMTTSTTANLNTFISGRQLTTSYGDIVFRVYTSTGGSRTCNINNVYLDVSYYIPSYTLTTVASPAAGGTVGGGGTYDNQATATLTAAPSIGYRFVKWNDDTSAPATRTVTVTGNATYTATFEKLKYTVTWKNGDTVLETDTNVEYGTTPTYNGSTPTKASTSQYNYTFSGWSPSVGAITGDTTFTAQFTESLRKYAVTFKNYDGYVLESWTGVNYGSTGIIYNGPTPTKPSTAQYEYTFSGWNPSLSTTTITGDTTFTAQFTSTVRKYTVTASGENGTVTGDIGTFAYGDTCVLTATPNTGYKFVEWIINGDPEGIDLNPLRTMVNQNLSIVAVFRVSKFYVGTAQANAIYIGTTPVKAIYIGTTKIYEQEN